MVSSKGSRVMEELGDTVKVYSADEWKKETEKRLKSDKKSEKTEKIELPELDEEVKEEKIETGKEEKPIKLNVKVKKNGK